MVEIEAYKSDEPSQEEGFYFQVEVKSDNQVIIKALFRFKRHMMTYLKQLEKEFKTNYRWI